MDTLYRNIAAGALHNAAERGDPPNCHPETRLEIRTEIITWIVEPGVRKTFVLWIYGPAGSGKTAIQQTIAEICDEMGILAASFFFSRTGIGRGDTSRFIPTLAYQLCFSVPALRGRILHTVEEQPSIFSSNILTQMMRLIITPVKELRSNRVGPREPR